MTTDSPGPLNPAEIRDFLRLLTRYAEHDLDQFANWRIPTTHGPVYLSMSRALAHPWPEEAFDPIQPLTDD